MNRIIIVLILCGAISASFSNSFAEQSFRERWLKKIWQKADNLGVGDHHFSFVHEGITRNYMVHLPSAYNRDVPAPVVIYLHGGGGSMKAAYMDGLGKMSDKHGFILAVPEGTGEVKAGRLRGRWNGGKWETGECCGQADDSGFISRMIDEIGNNFNIDKKMIYATGISNGGLMTNRLGCELADKIAAIAPVASAAVMSGCIPSRPMPVMVIHGTADPANPLDGSEPRGIFKTGIFAMPYKRMTPYQVVDAWRKINKCSEAKLSGYQRGYAKCVIYNECAAGAEIEFCIVEGMGHTYPGGSQYLPAESVGHVSYDISFDHIWEFFKAHPMK